jgi:hypothetical protein
MQAKTKKGIQAVLLLAFLFAGVRLYMILRTRDTGPVAPQKRGVDTGLDPDYYVVPKRLRAYDLQSAKELVGKPVWMKEGYRYSYYPYAGGRANFDQEAGTVGPIEKLEIKDLREQPTPGHAGQKQVLAIFEKEGKSYALPVGTAAGKDYNIYADEALFLQDPRELYKHWPAEVWQAIEQHQVKPGMNEIQASFSVGMGTPYRSEDPEVKTVVYPNGGKQLTVTYRRGKATRIDAAS